MEEEITLESLGAKLNQLLAMARSVSEKFARAPPTPANIRSTSEDRKSCETTVDSSSIDVNIQPHLGSANCEQLMRKYSEQLKQVPTANTILPKRSKTKNPERKSADMYRHNIKMKTSNPALTNGRGTSKNPHKVIIRRLLYDPYRSTWKFDDHIITRRRNPRDLNHDGGPTCPC